MSDREPRLVQTVEKGPNCYECVAVDVCPAITLGTAIDRYNADLASLHESVSDEMSDKLAVVAFGSGALSGIRDNVETLQENVNQCVGAITIENRERAGRGSSHSGYSSRFVNPLFDRMHITQVDPNQVDDVKVQELQEKGFSVGPGNTLEYIGESQLEMVNANIRIFEGVETSLRNLNTLILSSVGVDVTSFE